ncbi:ParA family protein [Streptosporangium sp. NPDC049248]|uniref:ParA family protein n=1 Tax=Streptosporangium sp. NPDC049248 TaxID=3155651 RepID=UPI0034300A9A
MAKVHVVLNQKGGVGKSTTTMNLAAVTADASGEQEATVVVSIDPQGSAVWWSNRVVEAAEELAKTDPDKAAARALPFDFVQANADDIEDLSNLRDLPGVKHVWVDTPGWIPTVDEDADDPFDGSSFAEALRRVLACADDVLIPIEPESLAFDPTFNTVEKVVKPRGIPYLVVANNWDPRDGRADLEETLEFVRAQGWPLARTVVRHYKVHTRAPAEGLVVTQYPKNRVAMEAREDFYKLALEHERMRNGNG